MKGYCVSACAVSLYKFGNQISVQVKVLIIMEPLNLNQANLRPVTQVEVVPLFQMIKGLFVSYQWYLDQHPVLAKALTR